MRPVRQEGTRGHGVQEPQRWEDWARALASHLSALIVIVIISTTVMEKKYSFQMEKLKKPPGDSLRGKRGHT